MTGLLAFFFSFFFFEGSGVFVDCCFCFSFCYCYPGRDCVGRREEFDCVGDALDRVAVFGVDAGEE